MAILSFCFAEKPTYAPDPVVFLTENIFQDLSFDTVPPPFKDKYLLLRSGISSISIVVFFAHSYTSDAGYDSGAPDILYHSIVGILSVLICSIPGFDKSCHNSYCVKPSLSLPYSISEIRLFISSISE